MIFENPLLSAFVLAAAGVLVGAGYFAVRAYVRYRGEMLVSCPETGKPAAVRVAAGRAARTAVVGRNGIRLHECTRWPERRDCGQECLSQIEGRPHDCLVQTRVSDWYTGQTCAFCDARFDEVHWHDRRPTPATNRDPPCHASDRHASPHGPESSGT